MKYRILVTGSRSWDDHNVIIEALLDAAKDAPAGSDITIVHGACPSGADLLVDRVALHYEWDIERHPAEWERFGKPAGFIRNRIMVESGADICLAFIKNESRGATHCAGVAEAYRIPVKRYLA